MRRPTFRHTATLIALVTLLHAAKANADCPAAPIANADDMAISFLASNGVQASSASLLASSVKEGTLIYDDTADKLKICDGASWIEVGSGGGSSQWTDVTGGINYAGGNVGIGTATPSNALHVAGGFRLLGSSGSRFFSERGDSEFDLLAAAGTTKRVLSIHAANTGTSGSVLDVYGHNGTGFVSGLTVHNSGAVSTGFAVEDPSAQMSVTSTTKGFLPPRMTTVQRDAIASPATGLMIFNTTNAGFEFYNGTAWSGVGSGVPNGTIAAFASTTCPTGWSEYTAARGRFLRGIDNGAGIDPAGTRAPGNAQADAMQQITGSMGFNRTATSNLVGAFVSGGTPGASGATSGSNAAGSVGFNSANSPGARTDVETRPTNVAVTFCIYNGSGGGGATTLVALSDVNITSPSDGQVLKYDNATSKWINGTASGGGATPAGTVAGAVQFRGATAVLAADDANLIWDDTNNRLGIGTVNPQSLLQVAGGIQLGDDAAACPGASDVKVGTLRFNTGNIQLCTTGGWGAISGGGTLSGGTSGYLGVWSGATTMGLSGTSAGQQLFWDGTNNRLLLGSVTAYQTDGSVTPRVQVHGTTSTASSLSLTSWLNGANNPGSLILGHSKSATIGTNVLVDNGDALGGIYFNGDGGAGFRRAAYIQANVDATPGTNNMPGRLIFATSADGSATPTERMRIDSAGNVGIGTTAPDVPLEFAATTGEKIRLWDGGAGSRLGIGLNAANFQFFTGAGGNNFSFNTGGDLQATGTNELMRIQANGNVGVGITTPTEKLFVGGNIGTLRTSSDYNVLALTNTGGVQLHLNANGNAQGNLRTVTNHPLSFSTNNIERVRIDTAGNVGIGTTAPTSGKLQVAIAPGNGTEGTSLALGTNDWGGGSAANIQFRQDMDQTNNAVAAIAAVTETGNLSGQLQFRTSASFGTGDLTSSNTRMTIQGNGTVGIGTMSPTAKLHIDGDILLAATLPRIASASYLTLQSGAGQAMTFNTGGATEHMRIDATGNVGIGTATPTRKLTTEFPGTQLRLAYDTNNWRDFAVTSANSFNILSSHTSGNPANTVQMSLDTGFAGNAYSLLGQAYATNAAAPTTLVGVEGRGYQAGTGAITSSISVRAAPYVFGASASGPIANLIGIDIPSVVYAGGATSVITNSYGLKISSRGQGVNRYGIYQEGDQNYFGGNVGIGTTGPLAKLSVRGDVGQYSSSAASVGVPVASSLYLGDSNFFNSGFYNSAPGISAVYSPSTSVAGDLAFYYYNGVSNARSEAMRVTYGGNVGIGTNNPSYLLHVNGTAYATGAAGALSDIRHKKDVHVLNDGAVAIITRLKPVSFQWKDPRDDGMKGKQFGFIAQDVEKVLPEIVLTQNNDEKTKGLKPTELIPFLTKAVQELSAANDNLRSELDELRSEIDALKAAR